MPNPTAPDWGFKACTEVRDANFRWGWGHLGGAYALQSKTEIGLVALGGFIRDPEKTYPEGRHVLGSRFQLNQLFWMGTDTVFGKTSEDSRYPSTEGYLQRLTEITRRDNEERYPMWMHYTVGLESVDGFSTGNPACSYDEMIQGVEYVVQQEFERKWNEIYDQKASQADLAR